MEGQNTFTFIDDFSRKTFVYFMKQKSEVLDKFKIFKALVEKQTGLEIQKLRNDNGSEYTSKAFKQFCEEHGIERQMSMPYTPQQNGVAERKNRTLFESARCMLQHKQLSNAFWAEAINTAIYVLNRAPTTVWHVSPPPPSSFRGQEVGNEPPHNEPRERGDFAFCLDHLRLNTNQDLYLGHTFAINPGVCTMNSQRKNNPSKYLHTN